MKGLFGGLSNNDANWQIRNFVEICQLFNITNISQESIRMRLFPFFLMGEAMDWLDELSQGSITSWDELIKTFIEQFFPLSRMLQLHNEITNFR